MHSGPRIGPLTSRGLRPVKSLANTTPVQKKPPLRIRTSTCPRRGGRRKYFQMLFYSMADIANQPVLHQQIVETVPIAHPLSTKIVERIPLPVLFLVR